MESVLSTMKHDHMVQECIKNRNYVAKAQAPIQACGLAMALAWILAEIAYYCGERWKHDRPHHGTYKRNGTRAGSIWIGGEKKRVRIHRIQNQKTGKTFFPKCYRALRKMARIDRERITRRVFRGIIERDYRAVEDPLGGGPGLSASSISRIAREESAQILEEFTSRDLSQDRYVAVSLDGTQMYGCHVMICLGFTEHGEAHVLGMTEMSTENAAAVEGLLHRLIARGLRYENGLLFVVDGAKGIHKAIRDVFGRYAVIQRCTWHKQENVLQKVENEQEQKAVRRALREAYDQDTHAEANRALLNICTDLESKGYHRAANSLREGMEETLTLHRLGIGKELRKKLRTTNHMEHMNSRIK